MTTRCLPIITIALAGAALVLACGDDSSGTDDPGTARGYVKCGPFTCNPGQYCENFACANGCTSDDNCKEGTSCQNINDVTKVGTCTETAVPATDGGAPSIKCAGKFKQLATCGLLETFELPYMEEQCGAKWSDTDIRAFDACVQAWTGCAAPIPTCLQAAGLKCGPKFPCPSGTCATINDVMSLKIPHQCY